MEEITKTLQKVKSSKQWKFVNDKAKAALVSLDETKTAILKALNHEYRPPKEKHVQKLLMLLQQSNTDVGEIISLIATTMQKTTSWIVAIKGLQVFHRLIQEGNERFIAEIVKKNPTKVLQMRNWKDPSPSSRAFVQTPFIRKYSVYLEQRVHLYRVTSIKGLSPKYVYPSGIEDTFKVLSNLQLCMDAILDCTLSEDLIDNSSSLNAVSMILKDSMLCYKLLSDGIIKCLDIFFKMDSKNAKEALLIYEKHLQQTNKLITYYGIAKKLNGIVGSKLPNLTPPPDTFLKQMKKYAEDPKSFLKEDEKEDMKEVQDISNLINDDDISKDLWKDEETKDDLSDIFTQEKKSTFNTRISNPQEEKDPFEKDPFSNGTNQDPFEKDPFEKDPFEKDPFQQTQQQTKIVQNNNVVKKETSSFDIDPFATNDFGNNQTFTKPIQQPVQQQPVQSFQQKPQSRFDSNSFQTLEPQRQGGQKVEQKVIPTYPTYPNQKQEPKKNDPFDFLSGITKVEDKPQQQQPKPQQQQKKVDPFDDPFGNNDFGNQNDPFL